MDTHVGKERLRTMRETWPDTEFPKVITGRKVRHRGDSKKLAGRRGCALSHKICAEIPNVTVLEDDIRIHGGSEALECWRTKIIPFLTEAGADAVYGGMPADPGRRLRGATVLDFGCTCTPKHHLVECDSAAGFIMYHHLSKRSANLLVGGNLQDCIVDTWFAGQIKARGYRAYCVVPFIAKPVAGVSCINQKHTDFSVAANAGEKTFQAHCDGTVADAIPNIKLAVEPSKTLRPGARRQFFGGRV